MALTKALLPVIAPTHATPFDVSLSFAGAATLTASGFATNANAPAIVGPGRFEGYWRLDVSAADVGSGDEAYKFFLLGSNDPVFGNANNEILAVHDIAATAALRLLPAIAAISPTVPDTGLAASSFVIPFSNQLDQFVFTYINLYVLIAGTTPSVTFSSWVSPFTGHAS